MWAHSCCQGIQPRSWTEPCALQGARATLGRPAGRKLASAKSSPSFYLSHAARTQPRLLPGLSHPEQHGQPGGPELLRQPAAGYSSAPESSPAASAAAYTGPKLASLDEYCSWEVDEARIPAAVQQGPPRYSLNT